MTQAGAPKHNLSDDLIRAIAASGGVIGMDYTIRDLTIGHYEALVRDGRWDPASYPPPPWRHPAGVAGAKGLPNLTERLLTRGVWSSSC